MLFSGVSFVNESKKIESLNNYFVGFEAPRTSLGIFKNGTIILAEVDGVEVFKEGASLYELAEWLVELGVYHSIVSDINNKFIRLSGVHLGLKLYIAIAILVLTYVLCICMYTES